MKEQVARDLLSIKAVALSPKEPYTWSSGIKSPIYCDNRLTLSYPEIRDRIASGLVQLIQEKYPEAEVIAGTATAGIPHAAWVAQKMNLPMIYVRSKAKSHGRENQIEGVLKEGQRVVVIEDLISTGGSSLTAVQAIREAGGKVLGVAAIFTYLLDAAEEAFRDAGIPYATITDYDALMKVAVDENRISTDELELLRVWRQDPTQFEKMI
ncbi:orotate phosphoribosyltransferase [Microaerobacter geothermalis]|uniref:orotate phosphoribosyltransferase n=1 Tax=Microaerobacter geothermalis TaxID=674972 RepID=UPI001F40A42C|nr:orotate phosphoribosyltransferase [Microaerobacter geothermalis]MCF6094769.1 orotate phosphoribosyltransferase [Microaerobacter geothermalis]